MENSYGIGVRNRYELFYNEDVDPLEILSKAEKNKKDKSAEKENKGKIIKESPPQKTTKTALDTKKTPEKSSLPIGNNKTKTERVKFSDREERNNRRNKPEETREKEIGTFKENKENKETRENGIPNRVDENRAGKIAAGRGTGGYRGRGALRLGGRGGPGGDFRGKREFDRQSGMVTSGVKAVDKRDGSGAFNWGSDKEQIEDQKNIENVDLDASVDATDKTTEEGSPSDENAQKEEEAQREMTLDEWKAMQKRDKPVFKIRRAGEGENQSQWKKTYVLKKKEEVKTQEDGSDVEDSDGEVDAHHNKKKVVIPIDFQFSDSPTRGGRGRGRGRGTSGPRGRGGAGRGGRGRFQGGTKSQEAPKMDDERDFPSLH